MHILHLLSQHEVTGAEVYAAQLANWQLGQGHQVWIVSDTFSTETGAVYIPRAIGEKSPLLRGTNALFVRKLIQKVGVQVVHAHSRAASKVGVWAVLGTEAALVSTVHGRQGWHGSLKNYDVYGQAVIAVCQNIRRHLEDELRIPGRKISVIPNGVSFESVTPREAWPGQQQPVLLLAGRTSGPKGAVMADFLANHATLLLERHPSLQLHLAGGKLNLLPEHGRQALARLQEAFGDRVRYLGFVNDLPARIASARAVIGSGRVAIEALGAGTPLYVAGEAYASGRITPHGTDTLDEQWGENAWGNFGDIASQRNAPSPDINLVMDHLLEDLAAEPDWAGLQEMAAEVRQYYDLHRVAEDVLEVYKAARVRKLRPGYIPVLMYHKVPLKPINSQHRVFVTKDTLEHQLRMLKMRGYTGITFQQYERFRNAEPGATLPKKPIVLTFDDAYEDNYTNAWPLLKKYGFTAVIYALGNAEHDHNFWDTPGGEPRQPLMTAAQKQEMATTGIEFGAHTQNHRDLTQLPSEEAWAEITDSRRALQELTGQPVLSFAYPYGRFTPEVKALVAKAGFHYAVAISSGGLDWEEDLLEIFRVYVFPEDTGLSFWKKTSPWYRWYFKRKRGV